MIFLLAKSFVWMEELTQNVKTSVELNTPLKLFHSESQTGKISMYITGNKMSSMFF